MVSITNFSDSRFTRKMTEWPKNKFIKLKMLEMSDFGYVLSD